MINESCYAKPKHPISLLNFFLLHSFFCLSLFFLLQLSANQLYQYEIVPFNFQNNGNRSESYRELQSQVINHLFSFHIIMCSIVNMKILISAALNKIHKFIFHNHWPAITASLKL